MKYTVIIQKDNKVQQCCAIAKSREQAIRAILAQNKGACLLLAHK